MHRDIIGFSVFYMLFTVFFSEISCVNITKLNVPEYIALEGDGPQQLILDCEYELDKSDTGFVLKWLQNNTTIYQWIYGLPPAVFPHMRGKIDPNYEASFDDYQKYRALCLLNPARESSGIYKCQIQTQESVASKVSPLKALDLRNYSLEIRREEIDDNNIKIICETKNIFPEPTLYLTLNTEEIPAKTSASTLEDDGYYDAYVIATVSKEGLSDESSFKCLLTFTGTNYTTIRSMSASGESVKFKQPEQSKNISSISVCATPHYYILSIVISTLITQSLSHIVNCVK